MYEKIHSIRVDCGCGCSTVEFAQWRGKNGIDGIDISHKIDSFYALQSPGYTKFKEAIKAIWCILTGKEFYFYTVTLDTKEKVIEFKKAVASLEENVVEYK